LLSHKSKTLKKFWIKQLVRFYDRKLIKKNKLILGKINFEVKNLPNAGAKLYTVFKPVHIYQSSPTKSIETRIENHLNSFNLKLDLFTITVVLVLLILLYWLLNNLLSNYLTDSNFLDNLDLNESNYITSLITEMLVSNEKSSPSQDSYQIKFNLINELVKSIL